MAIRLRHLSSLLRSIAAETPRSEENGIACPAADEAGPDTPTAASVKHREIEALDRMYGYYAS